MKVTNLLKLAAACAALGLSSQANALTVVDQCALSDVKQGGANANACAGSFAGNINIGSTAELNALTAADWFGTDPSPLNGWLYGDETGTASAIAGVTISVNESATPATWAITLGSYTEFVVGFKQGNEHAFYYFSAPTTSNGTYLLSWATGGGSDISHAILWVRNGDGQQEVPEPGTLALLGLGLLGIGAARKKLT